MKILLTVADIAELTDAEVACGRCARRGRLNMARLLAEFGPDASMREATASLNIDCPRRDADQLRDRCDVYHPELPRLMGVEP
jgi:hypothetical protein